MLQLQKVAFEGSMEGGLLALEGAIDPEAYQVGPGDQFGIAIGGPSPFFQVIPVAADGNLLVLDAGPVLAAGRSLAEVQRDAEAALKRYYRNVAVAVTLARPRMFYVHVTGAVPKPGRYMMLPIARVDDAIQQAYAARLYEWPDPQAGNTPRILNSATSERPAMNEAFQPALRNITITHRDGTTESLDLLQYYATGDTQHNPYLSDGDVITVPAYQVEQGALRVSGAVTYPGRYAYRAGETALDLLHLAMGPSQLDEETEVRLTRRTDQGAEQRTFTVASLSGSSDVPLEPGDHLDVLANTQAIAQIQGLVEYPGTYDIEDGETTLRELIDLAGGLKPDADLRAAFIERRASQAFKETGRISDLDFFSRTFLQSTTGANRLVMDVEQALQPGAPDIILHNLDRVVFPRDEGNVWVTGNVPLQGYVTFVEGRTASYYIEQAGGKGPLTQGIRVFDGGTGEMRVGENVIVRSGDTIFVDRQPIAESPELASLLLSEEASRRQTRIMTTQTVITGITAAISIIATLKSFGAFD